MSQVVAPPNRFVVVEGNIGAGKTTFVQLANSHLKSRLILEQFKENPFLSKFYSDRVRYAFPLELSFLAERYQQMQGEVLPDLQAGKSVLCDYFFMKSLIFAGFTLSGDELKLYRQMFDIMSLQLPMPDLYLYIHRPVNVLLQQIKKRGRPYEIGIDAAYLTKVEEGYFSFMEEQQSIPFVVVNAQDHDFENNSADRDFMMGCLQTNYGLAKTVVDM